MPSLDQGIDIIAYDQAGRVILLAEVKSRLGTSAQWAKRYRQNMLAHGLFPQSLFFVIATPDRMYFWKQDGLKATDSEPDFTMLASSEFEPYFETLGQTPAVVSEETLEILV